ncbi:DUF7221 family queuine tRNA-ribosyltransferase-like protein [Halarchaeum grantii]|uniref:deazapurine DNA modification protein DpdA family protein n=1 Tax=Halarchaeum grantii TaxID=1193105 RepID=UPI003CCC3AB2
MISYATACNTPWNNQYQSRDDYTLFVDSGGYHHMKTGSGEYKTSNADYLSYIKENEPRYWALRDFPCEPSLLSKLGRSIQDHQERTTQKHAELVSAVEDSSVPGEPVAVLQGWEISDYLSHIDELREQGSLTDYVGIGSVCRRHQEEPIVDIILAIREELPQSVNLHAFGVKNSVLQYSEVVDALHSADSSAYDYSASHCANRLTESFSYRDSLWSWLNWRRKLYDQVGSKSYINNTTLTGNKEKQEAHSKMAVRDKVWSAVLEILRGSQGRFTISDLLEFASMSESQKNTARRTLHSMSSSGWISHQPHSQYWYPGPKAQAELTH